MTSCPCGSKTTFDACCGPLIAGAPAPTAEALMRSRYVAFTLGNLDYIERTCTGPAALAFDRTEMAQSLPGTEWLGLEIRQIQGGQPGDKSGKVTFGVRYRHNGQVFTQGETSEFWCVDGAWRYAKGDLSLTSQRAPIGHIGEHIGRNDPCPCGSGKKYKKCCGMAQA